MQSWKHKWPTDWYRIYKRNGDQPFPYRASWWQWRSSADSSSETFQRYLNHHHSHNRRSRHDHASHFLHHLSRCHCDHSHYFDEHYLLWLYLPSGIRVGLNPATTVAWTCPPPTNALVIKTQLELKSRCLLVRLHSRAARTVAAPNGGNLACTIHLISCKNMFQKSDQLWPGQSHSKTYMHFMW